MKLDYTLTSPEDRNELVKQVLEETPEPTAAYLENLADYLILCMEKQEKREKKILTENRMATVNKRETSYEGLVSQLENGEDGIYNMIQNDKNALFKPKIEITQQDLIDIPELKEWRDAIDMWEEKLKYVEGRDAYVIKKMLIDMRKDQYLIKMAYKTPVGISKSNGVAPHYIHLDDTTHSFDADGQPIPEGFSLMRPDVISALLCNYSKLIENSYEDFEGDTKYIMMALDDLINVSLQDEPVYLLILEMKIDGAQNNAIQQAIQEQFGIRHSVEYISALWRKKIPNLIASAAVDQYLDYYYLNIEKGKYKKCNRCGQVKLANKKYFSKNSASKDGFYSICKKCRTIKKGD